MPASRPARDAIFTDFKAPAEMAEFVEDNARFFAELLEGRSEPLGLRGAAEGPAAWARTRRWSAPGTPRELTGAKISTELVVRRITVIPILAKEP